MGGSIWGFQARRQGAPTVVGHRGVLATRVNAHFEHQSDGRLIFYPLAEYGRRGYIVSSENEEKALRKRAWQFHIGSLVVQLAAVIGVSTVYGANILHSLWWQMVIVVTGFVVMQWAFSHIVFRRFTKNMTRSLTHNSPIAHWRAMGKTLNPLVLLLSSSFLAIMAVASLFFAIQQQSWVLVVCGLAVAFPAMIGGIALQNWWASERT